MTMMMMILLAVAVLAAVAFRLRQKPAPELPPAPKDILKARLPWEVARPGDRVLIVEHARKYPHRSRPTVLMAVRNGKAVLRTTPWSRCFRRPLRDIVGFP